MENRLRAGILVTPAKENGDASRVGKFVFGGW